MTILKNDLLLRALKGDRVERPPVWMMRQAGRYLPGYLKLREKYDFFTRIQTPELACEITLQPVDQVGVDAAIIFSDILVVPQAMGLKVLMEEGKGPSLPGVIKTQKDIDKLITENVEESLGYVMKIADALKEHARLILFPKGSWYALQDLSETSASGIGIDWCITPQFARELTKNRITLQGNFDPAKLLLPVPEIKKEVHKMIN